MSRKKAYRGHKLHAATAPLIEVLEQRTMLSVSGYSLIAADLIPGATFNYVSASTGDTVNYTVVGPTTAPGGQSAVEYDETITGPGGYITSQEYIAFTTTGLIEYSDQQSVTENGTTHSIGGDSFAPPFLLMPATLTAQQEIDNTTDDTNTDQSGSSTDTNEAQSYELPSQSMTPESVTAGNFNTYEVDYSETDTDGDPADTDVSTAQYFYAPYVGWVYATGTDVTQGTTDSYELVSYSIPKDTLKFVTQPANTAQNATIKSFSVELLDANGNVDVNSNAPITLALQGGNGTLAGTTTVDANAGVATFTDLSVNVAGNYTLDASSPFEVADVISNTFQITGDHLVFTSEPSATQTLGNPITMTVSVETPNNTVDVNSNGEIDLSLNTISGGTNAQLGGTIMANLIDGVANFDTSAGPNVDANGVYTITAAQTGNVNPATSATSTSFTIGTALTWSGAGGDDNWSNARNWVGNLAPVPGDSLFFPSSSSGTTNNDITGLSLVNIDIQGGGYTLSGNNISLTGGLTSEAGNNTYDLNTTLVGNPSIDDQTGDLTIDAVLSGANLTVSGAGIATFDDTDTYTGSTTLAAGVTIDDSAAEDAFGDGELTIGAGSGAVSIDDTGTGADELDNNLTFQDGATLAVDPTVNFTGSIAINGQAVSDPITKNDTMALEGDITGNGTLTITGDGVTIISNSVADTVQIQVSSATLDLNGALQSLDNQVTVNGGTLLLDTGLMGAAGIDVQSGIVNSNGAPNYNGKITLEQTATGQAQAQLSVTTDPLGTGTIVVATPTAPSGTAPSISQTGVVGSLVLNNVLDFESNADLQVAGNVTIEKMVTVNGTQTYVSSGPNPAILTFSNGIQGVGQLNDEMDGALTVSGDVNASVTLTATDAKGTLAIGGNLLGALSSNQVFDAGGVVQLLSSVTGNGGIDIQYGTLAAGALPGYTGNITVQTPNDTGESTSLVVTPDANDFGNAPLIFAAAPKTPSSFPAIVGPEDNIPLNFSDPIFLNGTTLTVTGDTVFNGPISVTGNNTISAGLVTNLSFTGTMSGSGALAMSMNSNTASITGTLASTLVVQAASGTVNLGATLLGDVGGPNQIVLSGGNVQLLDALTGNGGIDIQSGTLIAAGAPNYGGNITAETPQSGNTAEVLATTATSVLGMGQLIFAAPTTTSGTTGPYLVDGSSTASLAIDTPVVFQGATVNVNGTTNFAGTVTVNANSTLSAPAGTNLSFTGTLAGTATLDTSLITNTVSITGTLASGVVFDLDGTNPVLNLAGTLNGAASTTSGQIVIDAGTVNLLSGLQSNGAIDIDAGTLASTASVSQFGGNIILDQGQTFQDVIKAAPGTSVLGSGQLIINNFAGPSSIVPLLINTQGNSQTLVLDNTLSYGSGTYLQTQGSITFNAPVVTGTTTDNLFNSSTSDVTNLAGGVGGTGTLNLYGTGSAILSGTSTASIVLPDQPQVLGGSLSSLIIGNAVLNGGANEITVNIGTVILEGQGSSLGTISGGGGINMVGGILTTDTGGLFTGDSQYTGPVTINAGAVASDPDVADLHPFGSGTLTLNGGLLQNAVTTNPNGTNATGVVNPIVSIGTATIAGGATRFQLKGSVNIKSGTLLISRDVVMFGGLTGPGDISLSDTNTTLEVNGSNPTYTGQLTSNGGTVFVNANQPLGAPVTIQPPVYTFAYWILPAQQVNRQQNAAGSIVPQVIADPIIDNTEVVECGTLFLQGDLTFPGGIIIDANAAVEIEGVGSQIIITGGLTGAGNVIVDSGATFSTPGGTTGFTGTITQGAPTLVTPTLTVSDAGGVADGSPYPATATLSAPGVAPSGSLEGVTPTLTYYIGATVSGNGTTDAPSTAGTYTVEGSFAGSTDYAPVVSAPVTFIITPAPASNELSFFLQPQNTRAGWLDPVIVEIKNSKGQIATTDNSTVTLSVASGPGVLHGDVSVKAFHGVAIFWNLYLTTAGTYSLKATDGSDTSAVSHSFKITPAAPAKLVFANEPNSAGAGHQIGPVVVDVEDQYGNLETGFDSDITLSLTGNSRCETLLGTTKVRAVGGVATFTNLSVDIAGAYRLKASDGPCVAGVSNQFTVSPGPATQMRFLSLPNSLRKGKPFSIEIELLDQYGNVATGNSSKVTLSLGSHPKNANLGGVLSATAIDGIATFTDLTINLSGAYTLIATDKTGLASIASPTFNLA